MRAASLLASRLGLSGFLGLDFVVEDGTGAPYLIEMNPRCAPPCHLQLGEGRDLVEAFAAQLSGRSACFSPPGNLERVDCLFSPGVVVEKRIPAVELSGCAVGRTGVN